MKLIRLFISVMACAAILLTGCKKDNDPDTYIVTVNNDGNGTAQADATTAEAGATVKLTATPNAGYIFSKWTVESGGITFTDETTNPATFTMPANAVSVKAEFAAIPPDTYAIIVNNDGNGTAQADAETAEAGTIIELTATPAAGYEFSQWVVESGEITFTDATANPATFTMPANAVSVKAEFVVQKTYLIYLAGYYMNAGYDSFAYTLTNGVQADLLPPAGGFDAQPVSMTVSGGKTYVAGRYFDSEGYARACYWMDGTVTKLDGTAGRNEDQTEYVQSITVSDGKVYAAGSYMNNYNAVPCYWVDGALNTLTLPNDATMGGAYSIAVSGGKVYAAGYIYQNNKRVPGYWLDGAFVSLGIPDGATFQINQGMGIAVADKVYVMGTYLLSSVYYPCVWADGTRTELPFDASANGGAYGRSIAVSGGKVYVSGYSVADNRNIACYWMDGVRTDLNTPVDTYSMGNSIGVIDGKVYVSGCYYDSSYALKPCYWFDGERTDLDIPTGGTQASITGIYISE